MVRYKFNLLEALREAGWSQNKLMDQKIFSSGTLQYMRYEKLIGWKSIDKVCALLHCQPGDIFEWVPDR